MARARSSDERGIFFFFFGLFVKAGIRREGSGWVGGVRGI